MAATRVTPPAQGKASVAARRESFLQLTHDIVGDALRLFGQFLFTHIPNTHSLTFTVCFMQFKMDDGLPSLSVSHLFLRLLRLSLDQIKYRELASALVLKPTYWNLFCAGIPIRTESVAPAAKMCSRIVHSRVMIYRKHVMRRSLLRGASSLRFVSRLKLNGIIESVLKIRVMLPVPVPLS